MSRRTAAGGAWLDALASQKLEVKSARDALQTKGWLDTGSYALNWAISGRLLRGWPLGHMAEMFGDPGTGKSFLAARAIAMAQAARGVALLDDTEGAYNAEHAAKLGVNVDALAYRRSATVKAHLQTTQAYISAYRAIEPPGPGILVLDSIAQLSTEHEIEMQLDKRDMSKAAEMKAFFRIVGNDLFDLPVLWLATNHKIANIGNPFQQSTTGGGGGPKYMSSVRLDLRAISKIKQGNEVIGTICRVVVDKNRIVAPWKEVRIAIPFNQPISKASGLIPLLVALGVLEERGNFLYYQGQKMGRAYKTKERFLQQDETGEQILDQYPELLEEVDAAIAAGTTHSVAASQPTEEEAEVEDDE